MENTRSYNPSASMGTVPSEPYSHMVDEKGLNKKEILARMQDHDFNDEMLVSQKYLDYAVALHDEGHHELANKVAEMAYEEWTHAKFQMMTLMDEGYPIKADDRQLYEELKHRMKVLFRDR